MQTDPRSHASTEELVKEIAADAGALVSRELDVAKDDLKRTVAEAGVSALGLGVAVAAGSLGIQMLLMSFALRFRTRPSVPLGVGLGLLGVAGAAATAGILALPKRPFGETRDKLADDLKEFKRAVE